jgi:tetratricopeptide (TPR) repeat protein
MTGTRSDELNQLFVDALAERLRRQDRLEPHARRMLDLAAGDPRWLMRARVLQGYAAVYQGRVDDGHSIASEALAQFEAIADIPGIAAGRDLLSGCDIALGNHAAALGVLKPVLAFERASRSELEWSVTYSRMALVNERLGDFDEALRWHYRNLRVARASGDAAAEAMALGSLGGLQLFRTRTTPPSCWTVPGAWWATLVAPGQTPGR